MGLPDRQTDTHTQTQTITLVSGAIHIGLGTLTDRQTYRQAYIGMAVAFPMLCPVWACCRDGVGSEALQGSWSVSQSVRQHHSAAELCCNWAGAYLVLRGCCAGDELVLGWCWAGAYLVLSGCCAGDELMLGWAGLLLA